MSARPVMVVALAIALTAGDGSAQVATGSRMPQVYGPQGTTPAGCGPSRSGLMTGCPGGGTCAGTTAPCNAGRAGLIGRNARDRRCDWRDWWTIHDDGALGRRAISLDAASRERILGTLRAAFDDPWFDTRAAAVMAAGRVASPGSVGFASLREEMRALLSDSDKMVRESACLGLGLLGDPSVVPDLLRMYRNHPEARRSRGKDILPRQRAFAALAVGLIGMQAPLDADVVAQLVAGALREDIYDDLRIFPILALGMMRAQAAIPDLEGLAEDREAEELVRAHAIVALGRLGDRGITSWLLDSGLRDRGAHVRRSSAIALGLLSTREDHLVVEALSRHGAESEDSGLRSFSLIALGRIGGPAAQDFLAARLKDPRDRAFAALALGTLGSNRDAGRAAIGELILGALGDVKDDSDRGAFAIALGLLGHSKAVPVLMEELRLGGSSTLKGHVATALGLLRAKEAGPMIRELAASSVDFDARRRATAALALMGDSAAATSLLSVLQDSCHALSTRRTTAVGSLADRDVIAQLELRLSARLSDPSWHGEAVRAFSALALGILGDKSERPLLCAVRDSCNYLAMTEGLCEVLLTY